MIPRVPYTNFPEQFRLSRQATLAAVERVFERGDFILGREVELFEREFAALCGVKHAVGVANGTDSLILAFRALGIGPGDEVITASNSWISSASAIALVGATPVFADVLPDQTIDPEKIEKTISSKTKAILPVHLTGRCARLKEILEIGVRHGIMVIEDAAQSLTAERDGFRAGGAGLIGSFSLHPLKNLNAAGDAGILTTNDDAFAMKFRRLRNHGLVNRDEVLHWGYNSRLDTLQAAILRTRLSDLPKTIERRRAIAKLYVASLKELVECPVEQDNERHTYHVFVIQCDRRNELKDYLAERGVETKIHYPIPIHLQKAAQYLGYRPNDLPRTERQADRILSLPIHQYLTDEQVDWVSNSVRNFYGA